MKNLVLVYLPALRETLRLRAANRRELERIIYQVVRERSNKELAKYV